MFTWQAQQQQAQHAGASPASWRRACEADELRQQVQGRDGMLVSALEGRLVGTNGCLAWLASTPAAMHNKDVMQFQQVPASHNEQEEGSHGGGNRIIPRDSRYELQAHGGGRQNAEG